MLGEFEGTQSQIYAWTMSEMITLLNGWVLYILLSSKIFFFTCDSSCYMDTMHFENVFYCMLWNGNLYYRDQQKYKKTVWNKDNKMWQ